jgi:hypothetical protein
MRGYLMSVLAGTVVVSILAAGCDKKGNPATVQTPNAVGTWKSTISGETMTVVMSADTFTMDAPGTNGTTGIYSLSGTYALNKDTITFTSASCTLSDEGIPCSNPNPGIISGDQITMPIPYGDGTKTTLTRQ